MPGADLSHAFGLKPEEAIQYFTDKGARLGWDWTDTLNEAHAKEFTVAKVLRNDILSDIHGMLLKAKNEGLPFRDFLKELEPRLRAKGWWGRHETMDPATGEMHLITLGSPRRLQTIYQTNLQSAYMAGHYKQNMENAQDRPWWEYSAVMDRRTRPAHAALNGLTFRFDDPFWDSHHPPQGFNCRCSVRTFDDEQLASRERDGRSARRTTTGDNPDATLHDEEVEVGRDKVQTMVTRVSTTDVIGRKISMAPDPGFNHNPGAGWQTDLTAWEKMKQLPPERRNRYIAEQAQTTIRDTMFRQWSKDVLTAQRGREEGRIVGYLEPQILTKLTDKGVDPKTPFLTATDNGLNHAARYNSDKWSKGMTPGWEELRDMPRTIREAEAVLWDKKKGNLIFVGPGRVKGMKMKYAFDLNYRLKGARLNRFAAAGEENAFNLADTNLFEVLAGKIKK